MGLFRRKTQNEKNCVEESTLRELRREIKIGAFVAGAVLIFAVLIFIVGDISLLFQKKGYPLFVQFDSVAGLEKRTLVRIAGVKVGYVKDIRLKGAQAEVELSIFPSVRMPKGSRATLASMGILGEKYIEILPSENPEYIPTGGGIDGVTAVGIDQLGGTLMSVGDQIKEVSESLTEFLGEEETQGNFRATLANLSGFTADLKDFLKNNRASLSRDLQKTSGVIDRIDTRFGEVSQSLGELLEMLKETVGESRVPLRDNLENIKGLIADIEDSLRQLNDSLKKVNGGEGTIGKLINQPELYDRAEQAVGKIEHMIQPLTSLRMNLGLRTDYFGDSDLARSSLSLRIWRNPRQFFLAQIIHDPWKERFTYSLQGGMRWGDLASRAGIMESTFGAGIDYYALNDRLMFSLEGYDFNRRPRPRFRAWTRLAATKYLSFLVGLEDFSLAPSREWFFGVRIGLQ